MNGNASSSSKKDAAADERLATRLFDALRRTAGLKQACKHGLASKGAVRKQIDKCITRKGRIRWRRVFRSLKSTAAEDDDDDDDDEDEEEKASGGRMTPGAEGLFGAALEKWSEEKVVKPEPAEVEAKKAALKAAKKPMPMPFSNDLVFDLA